MQSADKKLILDSQAIHNRVREIGEEISKDYQGKEILVIGVLKGAFIFMADLIRTLSVPVTVDFIQVSSYGNSAASSGKITLLANPSLNLQDRHILLVEDIIDTGRTMRWMADHFSTLGAASVHLCCLIDKAERREEEVTIDYLGFAIPQGFLVGYGLDYNEAYRNLPHIYHLNL